MTTPEDETFIKLKYGRITKDHEYILGENSGIIKCTPGTEYTVDDDEHLHSYNDKPAIVSIFLNGYTKYWFNHGILTKMEIYNGSSIVYTHEYS